MKLRPLGSLLLSKAIGGFVSYKTTEGLSENTIASYQMYLKQWIEFQGDKDIGKIISGEITKYLAWLPTDYVPKRLSGDKQPLSPKTLRNIWVTAFCSF